MLASTWLRGLANRRSLHLVSTFLRQRSSSRHKTAHLHVEDILFNWRGTLASNKICVMYALLPNTHYRCTLNLRGYWCWLLKTICSEYTCYLMSPTPTGSSLWRFKKKVILTYHYETFQQKGTFGNDSIGTCYDFFSEFCSCGHIYHRLALAWLFV